MKTLLPLYVHPLEDAAAWAAAGRFEPAPTVVVNVHNGPGRVIDDAYVSVTGWLHARGVELLGYVDLNYGSRACRDVWSDINGWGRYPINGIFLDRAPADAASLAGVADAVQAAGMPVALNPGTRPDPGYARLAGTVCTFEGRWADYVCEPAEPDWPNAAHLVYGVPAGSLDEAAERLSRRVKRGLVTELDMPAPYRGLPQELRAL
jgi:hypothetical protein